MGTVDKRLLGHWQAARWRRHERAADELEADLERAVADAVGYIEHRRAALARDQARAQPHAIEPDDR